MKNKVLNAHVGKLAFYLLQARVGLLIDLGVDALHLPVYVCIKGVAFRAPHMSTPVESVHCKARTLEKLGFAV